MKFTSKLNSTIFFLIILTSFFTLNSCFTGMFTEETPNETDISGLPEKYFICDSLDVTPVVFTLTWEPKENDSVFISISGSVCSLVEYESGWLKDKVIQINVDAKKSSSVSANLLFGLSSYEDYNIQVKVSLEGRHLKNQDIILKKDDSEQWSRLMMLTYLPAHRIHKFRNLGGLHKLSWEYPKADIDFVPQFVEELENEKSLKITDYFTLTIESCKSNVSFYDKYLQKNAGYRIKTRINGFRNYQIVLNSPYHYEMDDTIFVIISCTDFVSRYKMVVTNSFKRKEKIKKIIVKFDKSSIFDGDTLTASVFYKDKFGNEVKFPASTRFEVGINEGCNFADILTPEGIKKKYVHDIPQPIRVVALDPIPDGETNFGIRVGLIEENDGAYIPDN